MTRDDRWGRLLLIAALFWCGLATEATIGHFRNAILLLAFVLALDWIAEERPR